MGNDSDTSLNFLQNILIRYKTFIYLYKIRINIKRDINNLIYNKMKNFNLNINPQPQDQDQLLTMATCIFMES